MIPNTATMINTLTTTATVEPCWLGGFTTPIGLMEVPDGVGIDEIEVAVDWKELTLCKLAGLLIGEIGETAGKFAGGGSGMVSGAGAAATGVATGVVDAGVTAGAGFGGW